MCDVARVYFITTLSARNYHQAKSKPSKLSSLPLIGIFEVQCEGGFIHALFSPERASLCTPASRISGTGFGHVQDPPRCGARNERTQLHRAECVCYRRTRRPPGFAIAGRVPCWSRTSSPPLRRRSYTTLLATSVKPFPARFGRNQTLHWTGPVQARAGRQAGDD